MRPFQFIAGFFRAGTRESSTRLIMLAWGLGVLFVWAKVCLTKGEMVDIPEMVMWLLLGLLGIKAGEKVGEKVVSSKNGEVVKPTDPNV